MMDPIKYGDITECLSVRYSNAAGGSITAEQVNFVRSLPVDLIDLLGLLADRGISVEVKYPPGHKPRAFPPCALKIRTSVDTWIDVDVPLDIPVMSREALIELSEPSPRRS